MKPKTAFSTLGVVFFIAAIVFLRLWSWSSPSEMAAYGQGLGALFAATAAFFAGLALREQAKQTRILRDERFFALAQRVSAWIENEGKDQGPEKAYVILNSTGGAIHNVELVYGRLVGRGHDARFAESELLPFSYRTIFPWEPGFNATWERLDDLFEQVPFEEIGVEIAFSAGGRRWKLDLNGELHPKNLDYLLFGELAMTFDLREPVSLGGSFSTWKPRPYR